MKGRQIMRIKDFAETVSTDVDFVVEDRNHKLVWGYDPDGDCACAHIDKYQLAKLEGDIISWHIANDGSIWIHADLESYTPSFYTMPEISNIKECMEEFFEYAESCGVGALL